MSSKTLNPNYQIDIQKNKNVSCECCGLEVDLLTNTKKKPMIRKRALSSFFIHFIIWAAITTYVVFMTIRGSEKPGYVYGMIAYVFVSLRLFAKHVCITRMFYTPLGNVFDATFVRASKIIPNGYGVPLMAVCLIATMISISFTTPVTPLGTPIQRLQSICGVIVLILMLYVTSMDRKAVPWRTVVVGMILQYTIALFVLKTTVGVQMFQSFSNFITSFLKMSEAGLAFLFGNDVLKIQNFIVAVFPAIVFFCSFISVVYYFGGMQYLVVKMAWLMVRLMDTSGAESVVAAASPFVGQGESALLVKPFVEYMTNSELHSTMTSGFSTIAGSVLLAYQQYLGDTSGLLTACVMSVPASLAVSKMRLPEKEQSLTKGSVTIPENKEEEANFLHAAGNGAATGVNLILLIGGALLSIVSLFAVADYLFGWAFFMVDIYDTFNGPIDGVDIRVSIKLALSFLFFPAAWLIGVPARDCRKAAEFMGLKMVVNEFVAYDALFNYSIKPGFTGDFDARTVKLLTFALCGFANVASIGVQIGCLTAMAPTRGRDLAKLAFSAMLTGTVSTWLCAAVAGSLM